MRYVTTVFMPVLGSVVICGGGRSSSSSSSSQFVRVLYVVSV